MWVEYRRNQDENSHDEGVDRAKNAHDQQKEDHIQDKLIAGREHEGFTLQGRYFSPQEVGQDTNEDGKNIEIYYQLSCEGNDVSNHHYTWKAIFQIVGMDCSDSGIWYSITSSYHHDYVPLHQVPLPVFIVAVFIRMCQFDIQLDRLHLKYEKVHAHWYQCMAA